MDGAAALAAHERAYRLAREAGEDAASARLAIELTFDCAQFRGPAEAGGWLERAGSLLERLPPLPEHALHAYLRANRALNGDHEPASARAIAAEGVAAAREAAAPSSKQAWSVSRRSRRARHSTTFPRPAPDRPAFARPTASLLARSANFATSTRCGRSGMCVANVTTRESKLFPAKARKPRSRAASGKPARCAWQDSNLRPCAPEAHALSPELQARGP